MKTMAALLILSSGIAAAESPAAGKLLVATDEIMGPVFAESVILLLSYNRSGAIGLVVNRPTDVTLAEVLKDASKFRWYADALYWGGPVEMHTLRALVKSDTAPEDAVTIFGSVHLVPVDEGRLRGYTTGKNLRLFLGYAGWGPGQLEFEIEEGSWRVLDATEAAVFADRPKDIWRKLHMPPVLNAALGVDVARR